ncbi:MAG: CotH protein/CotH kinase family protein [Treponematales bacterium]
MIMNKKAKTFCGSVLAVISVVLFGCVNPYEEKSGDTRLKSLSVTSGDAELIEDFDADTLVYAAVVPYATETAAVSAQAASGAARVRYSANVTDDVVTLDKGANTVAVTVTAENGATREYTVNISVDTTVSISGSAEVVTNSGIAQAQVFVNVYGEKEAAASNLIARAAVDLTTHQWSALVPGSYRTVYFTISVQDATGFQFTRAAGSAEVPETGRDDVSLSAGTFALPELTAFSFDAARNAGLPDGFLDSVTFDEAASTYTFSTMDWIENIGALKAVFGAVGTVTVAGVPQQSGVTANNFSHEVVYTVTAEDNTRRDYRVVFDCPQTAGLPVMKIDISKSAITSTDVWITGIPYAVYDAHSENVLSGSTDIKGRGNTTWTMPKKPYSLKLSKKASMLGMPEHKRWALLANYSDKTLLRTEVAFRLGGIFDNLAWTSRSAQAVLFMGDEYLGVYQVTEQIKIDTNRVNVSETISKTKPNGGYLLEIDTRKGEAFNFTTTRGVVFCCSDPDDELDEVIPGTTTTVFEKIQADVQRAEDVLYSDSFKDPDEGYRKYLDVASFVDWYLVNEVTKNNDAIFYSSVYMYYDPVKQKYCLGPVWDFDISLGNINYNGNDDPEGFWIKGSKWIARLFEDPYFVSLVQARWNAKKAQLAVLGQFVDERAAYLAAAQRQNFTRWNILNVYVWPNAVVTGSYQGEIDYLKTWFATRLAWLNTAIDGL